MRRGRSERSDRLRGGPRRGIRAVLGAGVVVALTILGCALIYLGLQRGSIAPTVKPSTESLVSNLSGLNVLVVTMCSVRSDRVGGSGYGRDTTPHLDTLAARGIRFTSAFSNAPSTLPAHASLLTGLLPDQHGVIDFETRLPDHLPSLAPVLGLYGFRTAWVMQTDSPEVMPAGLGQAQGFFRGFDRQMTTAAAEGGFSELSRWAAAEPSPFFALVLLRAAHLPYGSGAPFVDGLDTRVKDWVKGPLLRRPNAGGGGIPTGDAVAQRTRNFLAELKADPALVASLDAAYDSGVRRADAMLGELIDTLEKSGQLSNTLIIVVGDHGEALGDDGLIGHANTLHESVVRVPMVVSLPGTGDQARTISTDVSLVDVLPTVLELVGATLPAQLDGQSLVALLRDQSTWAPNPVRVQAAALPSGSIQPRAVPAGSALAEIVTAGPYRLDLIPGREVVARKRLAAGGLRPVTALEQPTTDALLAWRRRMDRSRAAREADRVVLPEALVEALRKEGYW